MPLELNREASLAGVEGVMGTQEIRAVIGRAR